MQIIGHFPSAFRQAVEWFLINPYWGVVAPGGHLERTHPVLPAHWNPWKGETMRGSLSLAKVVKSRDFRLQSFHERKSFFFFIFWFLFWFFFVHFILIIKRNNKGRIVCDFVTNDVYFRASKYLSFQIRFLSQS